MIFVVVVVAVLIGFVLLALMGRARPVAAAGEGPVMGLPADDAWLARIGPDAFERLLTMLFAEMRFDVERHTVRNGKVDLYANNATPITGMRVYVRGVHAPDLGVVGEEEVRTAIDTARAEQAGKAIVVTPGGFSPEGRAAAEGSSVDLVDGPELARLVRKHLPQVAAEKHL